MNTKIFKTIRTSLMIFLSGTILASCGGGAAQKEQQPEKTAVKTEDAQLQEYPVLYSFSGKLEAEKQSNLSTRSMGQVEHIYVKPGQHVNKGTLLLQIRNQDVLAKKAQAEAGISGASSAFENAKKDLERFEALYQSKSVTDKEMDDIRMRYQSAKANLDAAEQMQKEVDENLQYTSLRAPYSGIITGKFVQEGDMANPGMPLLSIESPTSWKVVARIPEEDISRLKLNDPVKVQFDALGGIRLEGVIAEINPSSANTGPQFEAKVLITSGKESTSKLYSGMYATVYYEKGTQPLMLVSKEVIFNRGQLTGIYTVGQNGNALLRWIRTGKSWGDSIEVLSGLSEGEKYIIPGNEKLHDGDPVTF